MKIKTLFILITLFLLPNILFAQEVHEDYQGTYRAKIIDIHEEVEREIWNDTKAIYKEIEIKFLDGAKEGESVIFESDFPGINEGMTVYVNHLVFVGGEETFAITNIDRRNQIYFLLVYLFSQQFCLVADKVFARLYL